MNENCKYCDYVSKCSRVIEYNSVMCKLHRSFPKVVDLSYEELEEYNKKLINILKELRNWLKDFADYSDCIKIISVLNKLNELTGEEK